MKKNYLKLNLLIWAVLTSALLSAQTNINIDFNDNKQTIRNFGASTGMHGGDIGTEWDLATKNEMARYLFDKNTGVGMSSFRLEIGSGTAQQGWYSGIRNKENKSESPLLGALPNGVYKIVNKQSGLALDLIDEHSENGAKVKQYSYWGGDNQKWVLTALGGGIYEVTNFKSDKCLEVLGWSAENGAIVQQWDCGGDNKRWQILPTGDGHYMFYNKNSRKALNVAGSSNAEGAGIEQWHYEGWNSQKWSLVPLDVEPTLPYDYTKMNGILWWAKKATSYDVEHLIGYSNSPPVCYTKNGYGYKTSWSQSTNLVNDHYDEFGEYMAEIADWFEREGAPLDYISPVNEPQFYWNWNHGKAKQEGTPWTNARIKRISENLSTSLINKGLSTQIITSESGSYKHLHEKGLVWPATDQMYQLWHPSRPSYLGNIPNMAKVATAHSYHTEGNENDMRNHRRTVHNDRQWLNPELEVWQTEYSLLGKAHEDLDSYSDGIMEAALRIARVMHFDLTIANVAAWQFWTSFEWGRDIPRFCLMKCNMGEHTYELTKNLWAIGNYSRFVRPNYKRVGCTGADNYNGVMASAYKDPGNSKLVVVMINYSYSSESIDFNFTAMPSGKTVNTFTPYITSLDEDLVQQSDINTWEDFVVPPRTIVTLVGDLEEDLGLNNEIVYIHNKETGRKIRPFDASDNSNVGQAPAEWTGAWNHWEVIPTENYNFQLKNIETGHYLTMPTANDYDIIKSTATATQKSEWTKVDKGNGNFLLENVVSGKRVRTTKHADMFNNPNDNFWVEVSPLSWEGDWVQWYFVEVPKSSPGVEVEDREITFYPNPANNYIRVEGVLKHAEVRIYSMSGQLVSTYTLNNNGMINLDNVGSGIYLLKAIENNKMSIQRIIIDKN